MPNPQTRSSREDPHAPGPLLVAVASRNGVQIDQHFGHADAFRIFRLDTDGVRLMEERQVAHYCQEEGGNEDHRARILRTLADCSAVFVARIGEGPRAALIKAGIEPVDEYPHAPIVASIEEWQRSRAGSP